MTRQSRHSLTPEYIRRIFPFLKDNQSLVEEILHKGIRQSIKEGTTIYWEGDSCSHLALILAGEIRVYKTSHSSREITLYEIGPGESCILNLSCLLSGTRYPANATTTTDIDILLVPANDIKKMMGTYHEIRNFVFTLLSQRLTSVMTLLEEVIFNRMDERLLDYLIEKAENDTLKTTHQAIANDLGTSREVVSRLLKDMERKGKIELSRNSVRLLEY